MLARIAHELFWLGRNIARAEHTARLLDGVHQFTVQGEPDDRAGVRLGWDAVAAIMGVTPPADGASRGEVIRRMTLDVAEPGSVASCVARARDEARTVRDVISADMWEAINTTHLAMSRDEMAARLRTGPYDVLQYVKERCAVFWGLTARTMLRDEASAFLAAGRRIESADMVLRMLRVALPPTTVDGQTHTGEALALLHAVGAFQAYRRAIPAPPNAEPVARFLLYERSYPNSVAASIDSLLDALASADASPRNSEPVLRVRRLGADLEFRSHAEREADLHVTCRQIQEELARVDHDIGASYFAGATGTMVAT
jgi:uncharacterized alpha-E superfamily protein